MEDVVERDVEGGDVEGDPLRILRPEVTAVNEEVGSARSTTIQAAKEA